MINFRNTLYVVNDRMTLDCELGRPTLSRAVFQSAIADKIIVMDRIGSLGKTFHNVVELAKVRTYVCTNECMYVRMYVCMYICMYVCIYLCIYVCMYVMYVCMHVCYVCMYVCMYLCIIQYL